MSILGSIKKWIYPQNSNYKYDEESVRYVVRRILKNSIDRELLRKKIEKELLPILGRDFVNNFYKQLNINDSKIDKTEVEKWMEDLKNKKI